MIGPLSINHHWFWWPGWFWSSVWLGRYQLIISGFGSPGGSSVWSDRYQLIITGFGSPGGSDLRYDRGVIIILLFPALELFSVIRVLSPILVRWFICIMWHSREMKIMTVSMQSPTQSRLSVPYTLCYPWKKKNGKKKTRKRKKKKKRRRKKKKKKKKRNKKRQEEEEEEEEEEGGGKKKRQEKRRRKKRRKKKTGKLHADTYTHYNHVRAKFINTLQHCRNVDATLLNISQTVKCLLSNYYGCCSEQY